MKNDEHYVSLYDYKGQSSRESGLGQKVYEAAKEQGIHVIYTDLPEERQRPEYTRVATYPKTFLDDYFGVARSEALEARIVLIETKLEFLQNIVNTLINPTTDHVANSNEWDDELPF